MSTLLNVLLLIAGIFLILIVLVQRGKGGGLAGALGGAGGYSAFGTRAGDVFTKITIGVASFWILVAVLAVLSMPGGSSSVYGGREGSLPPLGDGGMTAPADEETGGAEGQAGPTGAPGQAEQPAEGATLPLQPPGDAGESDDSSSPDF